MAAIGGGAEVGGRNLAVWPKPRGLALVVVDQAPSGFVGGQGIGQTVDGGSNSAGVEEWAEADATIAIVRDLVAEGLLVHEDALAIEPPDRKPRWLGTAGVANILGRLDAEGIAAQLARAAACTLALGFSAQPAETDPVELGQEAKELLPAEDVTVEGDLGGFPALDDGEEAGDATGVLYEAARDRQFEAGISALVVLGDGKGAERRQRVEAPTHEWEGWRGAAGEGDGESWAGVRGGLRHHRVIVLRGGSDGFLLHRRGDRGALHRIFLGPTKRGCRHPSALDVGGEPVVGEGIEILHAGGDAQVGLERLFALGRVVGEQHREAGKARIHVVLVGGPGDELADGLATVGRLGVDIAPQDSGARQLDGSAGICHHWDKVADLFEADIRALHVLVASNAHEDRVDHARAGKRPEGRPTRLRAVLEGHAPNGLVRTVRRDQVVAANLDHQLGPDEAGHGATVGGRRGRAGAGREECGQLLALVSAPAGAHAPDGLVATRRRDESEQQLGDTMLGANVTNHGRIDRYLGLDLEDAAIAGVQDQTLGTAAGDDALEESGHARRSGHGLGAGAVQVRATMQELFQAREADRVGRARRVRCAIEEHVEGREAKPIGLGESAAAHRRVEIKNARSAIGARSVQLTSQQAGPATKKGASFVGHGDAGDGLAGG